MPEMLFAYAPRPITLWVRVMWILPAFVLVGLVAQQTPFDRAVVVMILAILATMLVIRLWHWSFGKTHARNFFHITKEEIAFRYGHAEVHLPARDVGLATLERILGNSALILHTNEEKFELPFAGTLSTYERQGLANALQTHNILLTVK